MTHRLRLTYSLIAVWPPKRVAQCYFELTIAVCPPPARMGTVSLAAPLHSVPRRVLQPMKGLPHLLTAVLSFFATGAQRALRRNPCSLLLIVLLSPWAYFVWQVHSHFGGLVVSPLRTYESRSLAPVQVPPAPPPVLLVTALYPLSHASHSLQVRDPPSRGALG